MQYLYKYFEVVFLCLHFTYILLWYNSWICIIIILVSVPRVITHPTDTSAAAPFSALLICSIQAYGYHSVIWYRNNNSLPSKAYSTLLPSVNVTTSVLTIPNVTSEDVGAYYCVAWIDTIAVRSLAGNLILTSKLSIALHMCKLYGTSF